MNKSIVYQRYGLILNKNDSMKSVEKYERYCAQSTKAAAPRLTCIRFCVGLQYAGDFDEITDQIRIGLLLVPLTV